MKLIYCLQNTILFDRYLGFQKLPRYKQNVPFITKEGNNKVTSTV